MANTTTKKSSKTTKQNEQAIQAPYRLQAIFYGVWSIVGALAIILIGVAVFGEDTWVENLNLADTTQVEQQPQQPPQAQPQQPPQPSQEQLDCVADEVGEERLAELEQGDAATDDEALTIQECLQ